MQHLEVSGAVRPIYGLLGVKRLIKIGEIMKLFLYIFREFPFKNVHFQNINDITTYHYSGYQMNN